MKVRATCQAKQRLLQAAADGRLEDVLPSIVTASSDGGSSSSDGDPAAAIVELQTAACASGCKALHWAAGNGHLHVVEALLLTRMPHYSYCHHNDDADQSTTTASTCTIEAKALFHVDCPAIKKSHGRTALHYACRNGHYHVVVALIERFGANPDARARHSVTPLQLACWQGRLKIAKYLVETAGVDPHQVNDFDCGLVHWMGLAPADAPVVEMATWLHKDLQLAMKNHVLQRQGHSPLHKAAWGGHLSLCRYLHETVGLWDDVQDAAGNYAVDLARMAQHNDNAAMVDYLQRVASRATLHACRVLEVSLHAHERSAHDIQRAYRTTVRSCHPDGRQKRRQVWLQQQTVSTTSSTNDDFEATEEHLAQLFHELTRAYRHLMACATNDRDNDKLLENHASHELPRLLTMDGSTPPRPSSQAVDGDSSNDCECFEARLLQVVRQCRNQGMDLSNLVKKWKQVWPGVDFPAPSSSSSLQQWIRQEASLVVTIRADDQGVVRLYPRLQST